MARFVSKSAKYRVIVQGDAYMVLQNGERQQIRKPLVASFGENVLTAEEVDIGVKSFRHLGLPEVVGTEEDASPRPRISGFDSEQSALENGWTAEEHDLVVTTLRNSHAIGVEFMELIPAPAATPWPTYDETAQADVVKIAVATGTLELALAYEKENRSRGTLIEDLEEALAGPQEVTEAPVVIEA